jgi:two-component system, chemotaxis family, protein-glutamate methylesterase/glutaminase
MIRVLIVDDSALVRAMVRQVMEQDSRFEIAGEASNGENAVRYNEQYKPDLIIMDINMPIMDGIEATKRILVTSSPVVIIFTTEDSAVMGYRCILAGALEVISKPDLSVMTPSLMTLFCDRIAALCEKHVATSSARIAAAQFSSLKKTCNDEPEIPVTRKTFDSLIHISSSRTPEKQSVSSLFPYAILAAGASTGGPAALQRLLTGLGSSFPLPVLITQHIDASFDTHFAEWLNESTGMPVEIARTGTIPLPGHAYLAPADRHLIVIPPFDGASRNGCILQLSDEPPLHFLRPAVDKLFFSVADVFKDHALAVLLTGMGRDGADGCKKIVDAGGYTIAESESSCAVFGMPRAAIECGGARAVVPIDQIPACLCSLVGNNRV